MVGIYDCFGYGGSFDVPFEKRYRLIKLAGLEIDNMHTPVHEQNCLSLDNLDGESVYQTYQQCVEDCAAFNIPTMVIHLPTDKYPINELGLKRLEKIIYKAEDKEVQIAFENLENINNLDMVLNIFVSKFIGFCYDSCHHQNYAPHLDLLNKYGNRLMALHLQDNGGKHNQHQLPFDGNIDWTDVMKKITLTGYQGATTLEPMNWDYEDLSIQEFLDCAYQKAKQLNDMREL